MLVMTYVNKAVYEKLKSGETVYPVLGESYNREGIVKMYDVLKQASGFESFFFAIKVGSADEDHAIDLCQTSSEGNDYGLILDIPEDELFCMNYYTYSDMLYFNEFHADNKEDIDYVKFCKNMIVDGKYDVEKDVIQVIYKKINPKYIVKYI